MYNNSLWINCKKIKWYILNSPNANIVFDRILWGNQICYEKHSTATQSFTV